MRGAAGRRLRRRARCCPPTRRARTRRSRRWSARWSRAGAIPLVLGGDHSIAEPDVRAWPRVHGPVGLVHFDTHTDTGEEVFGVEVSHGTPMYRLVARRATSTRARYVQIGLRGYWPGEREFAWQAERGITSFFMHDVRELGHPRRRRARRSRSSATGPVFLSVDVDVLDPAFAPGHRHARAGRHDERRPALGLPRAGGAAASSSGMDVVEVIPTAVGSADVTALVAERDRARDRSPGSRCAPRRVAGRLTAAGSAAPGAWRVLGRWPGLISLRAPAARRGAPPRSAGETPRRVTVGRGARRLIGTFGHTRPTATTKRGRGASSRCLLRRPPPVAPQSDTI